MHHLEKAPCLDDCNHPVAAVCLSLSVTAEVIVTVGGEDDKVVLRSVESFDPLTSQWKSLACLPFAVSKHGLVVSGECVKDVTSCDTQPVLPDWMDDFQPKSSQKPTQNFNCQNNVI